MNSPWKTLFPSLQKANTYYLDSAATTQVPQIETDNISVNLRFVLYFVGVIAGVITNN